MPTPSPATASRFKQLLDSFLPRWRDYRDELNRAPLAHEDWAH